MAKGMKTGGRKKGTPNKRTNIALRKAQELGIDPFEVLLHFAAGNWEELGYQSQTTTKITKTGEVIEVERITPELRSVSAARACEYLIPKLKAIELSSQEGEDLPRVMLVIPSNGRQQADQD